MVSPRKSAASKKASPASTKKCVESPRKAKKKIATKESSVSDEDDAVSDAYEEVSEPESALSEALDDDDFDEKAAARGSKTNKRKRGAPSPKNKTPSRQKSSPRKRVKRKDNDDDDAAPDDEGDEGEEDGTEVVGTVVQAPKIGRVPPGQISQNTLNFLKDLQDPECNDRQWFKLHEPVYRQAEKEWKDFIDEFTPVLVEVDPQIPVLPPNDVVHRIYRDVRFSNDKTPYKTGFSASFSRSGRKGIFAGYHLCIKNNGSFFAAGTWCPGKNEIQAIRSHILRRPRRLRDVISAPAFVKLFGQPKRHPKGERQNIFGMEDELKTAPKGISKEHPDIDLLKCRSFAVSMKFTNEDVLDPNFTQNLASIVAVVRPFVHRLNDMMTVEPTSDSEDEAEEEE